MAIGDDFSINRATGDIRAVAGVNNYTVLEFYQWIRSLGDDQLAAGDDLYDITDDDIIAKQFDTIITLLGTTNIDDATSQRLYNGSIIQGTGGTQVIYDGIKVIAPAGTYVYIIQNGAVATNFWTTSYNPDAAQGVSHQFLLKVTTAGADIDGRRLLGMTREFGSEYNEFLINGTERGVNVLPLSTKADLNNETAIGTIAALVDITNTEGYRSIDIDDNGTPENYYSEWDRGANSMNTFYEYGKWLTRRGETTTLYGVAGELFRGITHEIAVDGQGVTDFIQPEPISWPTGTGQLLAVDDVNAASIIWFQLLTGVAPGDNDVITGSTSGATCNVNITITARPIPTPFTGPSTGSSIVGAFGLGFQVTDVGALDKLTDLTGTTITPPNNQTGTVTNLISGDSVLVGPKDVGDAFDYSQFTLNGALVGGEGTIPVNEAIPTDMPKPGTLRVFDGTNRVKVNYTGYAGSSFTGCTGTPAASNGAAAFVSFIDGVSAGTSMSFGATYLADREMWCQVRNDAVPIKTFKASVTYSSSGFSLNAIRNPD